MNPSPSGSRPSIKASCKRRKGRLLSDSWRKYRCPTRRSIIHSPLYPLSQPLTPATKSSNGVQSPRLFSEMKLSSFLAVGVLIEIKPFWPFPNGSNGAMPCQRFSSAST
jgi:hypothetical protein